MKSKWIASATIFACGLSLVILIFSCIAAASDAQGAILFIITFPLMFGILGLSAYFAKAGKGGGLFEKIGYYLPFSFLLFNIAFLVCAFIPGLRVFPQGVMDLVVKGYVARYGMTPYQAAHVDMGAQLDKMAAESGEGKVNLNVLLPFRNWNRVCIFPPYTSDEEASQHTHLPEWKLSYHMDIATNDGIVGLAFLKEKELLYITAFSRSSVDFDLKREDPRCYSKDKAIFRRKSPTEKAFVPVL